MSNNTPNFELDDALYIGMFSAVLLLYMGCTLSVMCDVVFYFFAAA